MTFWTETFCDICYYARKFSYAHAYLQPPKMGNPFRNYYIYSYDLTIARIQLECVSAMYRVLRKGAVNEIYQTHPNTK